MNRGRNWGYPGHKNDLLALFVNRHITLHGVCLFGSANNSHTVTLAVKDTTKKLPWLSKRFFTPISRGHLLLTLRGILPTFSLIIWLKRKTLKGTSIYISMPSAVEIYIDRLVDQHKNATKMLEKNEINVYKK